MRSGSYYITKSLAKGIIRESNRVERAREAAIRREEKEKYIAKQVEKANELNLQLINEFESLKSSINDYLFKNIYFDFEKDKKTFIPKKFSFKDEPEYIDNASEINVPNYSDKEKIFKFLRNRRLRLEKEQQEQKLEDIEEYKISLQKYNEELEEAKKKFNKKEAKRHKKITEHNNKIDEWKQNCYDHEQMAVEKFFNELVKIIANNMTFSIVTSMNLSYDSETKTIKFCVYVDPGYAAMSTANYRYVKSRDCICSIEDLENKKRKMDYIFSRLAMVYTNFFFKNNLNDLINRVTININNADSPEIIYIKSNVEKMDFKNYNDKNLDKFIENCVKVI